MLYRCHTVEGRLILPPEAEAYLRRYHDEPVLVEVTPVWSRRSIPQNRRLWLGYSKALKRAAALLPYDKDELHAAMKQRSEVIPVARLYFPDGSVIGDVKSSKRLSVSKFSDYLEEVTATFARGGIDLYEDGESHEG